MAVVKADAYGHGMLPVAATARAAGADWLGVALPSEAVALRQAGDRGRVLAWLYSPTDDLTSAVAADVDLSASAPWAIAALAEAAARTGRSARVHLKIDTGLGRSGASTAQWPQLLAAAAAAQATGAIEVVGIWSHLACGDEPDLLVTKQQQSAFDEAWAVARQHGLEPSIRHLANSGATLLDPSTHYELVRCGIAVYGQTPSTAMGTPADLGLQPAMRVTAEVAHVKRVPAGHGVSYGLRYRTSRETTLVLVPVGYADGVPRAGSGSLPVSLAGQRFVAAGTIAMDQFVIDVGDTRVQVGDTVELFGGPGAPTAVDWAQASGTINYEIVTRLGTRIPRTYLGGNGGTAV